MFINMIFATRCLKIGPGPSPKGTTYPAFSTEGTFQKYGAKEFRDINRILRQQGYEITVLYDPTEYLRKQQEAAEERKALTETKRRELEAKKREAEKAALKAEILKELKESGVIPSEDKKPVTEPKKTDNKPKGKK